jgi:hypothetical protein
MRDEGDLSIGQIVGALKAVGIVRSRAWVIRHIALTELDAEVQQTIAGGDLQVNQALQLRQLPADEQRKWARRIVEEGIGAQTLERLLDTEGGAADRIDPFLEPPEQRTQRVNDIDSEMRDLLLGLEGQKPAQTPNSRPDGDHRDGAVRTRWEFMPLVLDPAKRTVQTNRKLQQVEGEQWFTSLDGRWRRLAEEVFLLGGLSPEETIALIEGAKVEEEAAWEPVMVTLHGLRMLAENPDRLPRDSALATFLRIRIRRVLSNLV